MRKFIALFTVFFVVLLWPKNLPAAELKVLADAAILMNVETGEIIYQKNAFIKKPPASTTKILTALLVIEKGELDQVITVSNNAASVGEASLNLFSGDKLTLENVLHGALLRSANDACVALAEAIAPSEEEFVNLMNLKAKILGAEQTTFYNTNGLPHQKHLTSAYDLAQITRYALNNPVFTSIVSKKYYTVTWEESTRKRLIKNTNKLLWSYPYAIGVKTGTTVKAGKCLVAAARSEDKEMIAVVLNTPDRFGDAQRLLDFAFR